MEPISSSEFLHKLRDEHEAQRVYHLKKQARTEFMMENVQQLVNLGLVNVTPSKSALMQTIDDISSPRVRR